VPKLGYREIADQLRNAIASGEIRPGSPIASESELASAHGVTRTTARRALTYLEDSGVLDTVVGRGRFVRSMDSTGRVSSARFEQVADVLRTQIVGKAYLGGAVLGTEAELSGRFEVSQGTVRRALQDLAAEGLVSAVPGRGWFVRPVDGLPTRTEETAAAIEAAISAGEWNVGERIPGEVALAERFGVARVTVRRALTVLESGGVLERQPGRGRMVLPGDRPEGVVPKDR
jgi:DNA-binding GntR family transcriptional regulator